MFPACPSLERLSWLLREERAPAAARELVRHLDSCADCQRRLEELAGGTSWLVRPGSCFGEATPGSRGAPSPAAVSCGPEGTGGEFGLHRSFGRYRTLAVVHSGAMAIVLKAEDVDAHRTVALKTLHPIWAADRRARASLLREARAMTMVDDRHVIRLEAIGERNGCPYLVMPWIGGESLDARIHRTGCLPPQQVLRLGAQLARGLAAVHATGYVHRDVKPGNVMLAVPDDCAQLIDFGLATLSGVRPRSAAIVGTPGYLAPEQVAGMPVDHRADLFGLGATLYAACSGRSPGAGSTTTSKLRLEPCREPHTLRRLRQELPEGLYACVERLLDADPWRRPQSALAVATHCTHLLGELSLWL